MRTNIKIDDKLITQATKALNVKTKKEAVEAELRMINERAGRENMRTLRGKVELFSQDDDTTMISK